MVSRAIKEPCCNAANMLGKLNWADRSSCQQRPRVSVITAISMAIICSRSREREARPARVRVGRSGFGPPEHELGVGWLFSMRDLFEEFFANNPLDPTEAARLAVRPRLMQRFYSRVGTASDAGGVSIRLDDRPIKARANS